MPPVIDHAHADVFLQGGAGLHVELGARRQPTPEQRLLAALLARAIFDARAGHRDALAWLASDVVASSGRGFSFLAVCHALAIDPAWARAEIAQRARPRRRRAVKVQDPRPSWAA